MDLDQGYELVLSESGFQSWISFILLRLARLKRDQIWLNDNLPVVEKYPVFRTKKIQPLISHIRFILIFVAVVNVRIKFYFYNRLLRIQKAFEVVTTGLIFITSVLLRFKIWFSTNINLIFWQFQKFASFQMFHCQNESYQSWK